jgi:aspartate/methionine/tyrosine aminotransferase
MRLAERLQRLGTETAFAVSAEAAAHAVNGNRIYPFHLGDINLPTPPNIVEASIRAIHAGKTGYCPNYGVPALREALAADISRSHGVSYGLQNVAIQPGGKPVVGKFILALMNPGDEVLYPNPGYPIYESQIEFHGGRAVPYGFREGADNFTIDIDAIERAITPRTRLIIINDLQNPLGAEASAAERARLARLAVEHDLYVLLDEAYFEIRYNGVSTSLVAEPGMRERSVLLYTFSKKYAMTGWRLGAAVGPREVVDVIAKLNVNDESCSNHFIQYGAIEGLTGDPAGPRAIVATLKERRDVLVDLLNAIPGVRCYRPEATFYLFPNVTELAGRLGFADAESLRRDVLRETGVSFCTRRHFGRPAADERERYLRFAYSGIDVDDIRAGMAAFTAYVERRLA